MMESTAKEMIDVNELVKGLEKVLEKANSDDVAVIKKAIKAIDVLNKGTKVQVGENELIILSGDLFQVKKSNTAVFPSATLMKENEEDEDQDHEKYVSTKEVADYYGVTTETVRDWIQNRILPAHRVGKRGRYKIPREAFEFMKQKRDDALEDMDEIMKEALGDDYSEDWEFNFDDEGEVM
ncbi:helix-turn-helix domain-containing protein [Ammoniphilus sp. YIM 78166]|uniref:helix-turn-helix domain-containing protein n=1 Tax=Ammoniphilus sp. YIM 78166 TaxID=1644106 RepID=UPI0014313E0F|nr:helix-turn-helix domain-containing protein [Ammoniphilus sp. YIM 78166]